MPHFGFFAKIPLLHISTMETVIIHYSEIGLKGKNRPYFENRLIDNMKQSAINQNVNIAKVNKRDKRIVVEFDGNRDAITKCLKCVFGIEYFMFVKAIEKNIDVLMRNVEKNLINLKNKGIDSISFKTKRQDKTFPFTSVEVNKQFGKIAHQNGIKVDYKNASTTIYTEICNEESIYISEEKMTCHGGLPVGTSGKVLTLLSGGLDSPVAAWNVMKRGCHTDFIHIHSFRTNQECMESKIYALVKTLNNYQFKSKLFLIPYSSYESLVMGQLPPRYDLVFFKHIIFRLADRVALRKKNRAIVSGDNIGQVASQTLENMSCTELNTVLPIFRPLLTYNKIEITNFAKEIGTFDISTEEYKDCCSIQAKHPLTKTKIPQFKEVLVNIDVENIIEQMLSDMEVFEL